MAAIQIRPDRSWSATDKKRPRIDLIFELNFPSEQIYSFKQLLIPTWSYIPLSMSENLLSRFSRGTLTLSKDKRALSTPLSPIRCPMSLTVQPGIIGPATPSRILTRIAWTPCHSSSTFNWANTTQCCACSAPFVIQYLWASSLSESIFNLF